MREGIDRPLCMAPPRTNHRGLAMRLSRKKDNNMNESAAKTVDRHVPSTVPNADTQTSLKIHVPAGNQDSSLSSTHEEDCPAETDGPQANWPSRPQAFPNLMTPVRRPSTCGSTRRAGTVHGRLYVLSITSAIEGVCGPRSTPTKSGIDVRNWNGSLNKRQRREPTPRR